MKTVGFIKSDKENEKRICLIPSDLVNVNNKQFVYVEEGYGRDLNIDDKEYLSHGCNVVNRDDILKKDIIVDPKIGDAKYLKELKNKIIFGWIHAVQNKDIADMLVDNELTAFAWEDMFENGRHSYWRNNEVAGEAAVMHALILHGIMPYDANIAIIGNGNTSRGAYRVLTQLGAKVKVYNRRMEELLRKELNEFDIVVNAVLWDVNRKDHIIYKENLKNMKKGALIIDISCDRNGAIETSIPTTFENPIYYVNGIAHYAVDHTPSLVYKTISSELSKVTSRYIDQLIEETYDETMINCKITEKGKILDKKIMDYQKR